MASRKMLMYVQDESNTVITIHIADLALARFLDLPLYP